MIHRVRRPTELLSFFLFLAFFIITNERPAHARAGEVTFGIITNTDHVTVLHYFEPLRVRAIYTGHGETTSRRNVRRSCKKEGACERRRVHTRALYAALSSVLFYTTRNRGAPRRGPATW